MNPTHKTDILAATDRSADGESPAENVKIRTQRSSKKQALQSCPRLERTTFRTSREMDFFSEKELVAQTGHDVQEWPLVFVKEAVDNALDACEDAGVAPVIDVTADASGITVRDNGLGLPEATLKSAADFSIRASNREAYVSPCRGAQGNALKTLLAMPRVIDPDHGRLIVQAHGKRHFIKCGADSISQRAVVHDDASEMPTAGTELRIEWSARTDADDDTVWPFDDLCVVSETGSPSFPQRFREIIEGFALFNPHATIRLDWFGKKTEWKASELCWEKWKPHQPTSSHWYEQRHLERLIGAYITHDREAGTDRLVSDFIAEFDGLTGSQKRAVVLEATGLKRVRLSEFVLGERLDSQRIAKLLAAMQQQTKPVTPQRLGLIGEEHFRLRLLAMGVLPSSFRYTKSLSKEGMPWVLESAFGWLGADAGDSRQIYAGANWSAAIQNPFRSFGATGQGLEAALSDMKVGAYEPVVFALHLAHPRIEYTDRGKSALIIGGSE
jgi:hypothetical protein